MHELAIRARPVARMPLLPRPHSDEAFGSWLHRCADAYFMPNREEFAAGVLALEGQRLPAGAWDWDCGPPPPLLDALARRTPYSVAQLEAMLVPVSPNVLRQAERDAFCPVCHEADRAGEGPYQRKAWLDAWTLSCPVHHRVLGAHAAPKSYLPGDPPYGRYEALRLELERAQRVHRFRPPAVAARSRHGGGLVKRVFHSQGWYEPAALASAFGRRVMLLVGCEGGRALTYAALGMDGPRWLDDNGIAYAGSEAPAPRASLQRRLMGAMAASVLCGVAGPQTRDAPVDRLPRVLWCDLQRYWQRR